MMLWICFNLTCDKTPEAKHTRDTKTYVKHGEPHGELY